MLIRCHAVNLSCLLILILLSSAVPICAQPSGSLPIEVHLPIEKIVLRTAQSFTVRIPIGSVHGLKPEFDGRGYVWRIYRAEDSIEAGTVIASSQLISVNDTASTVIITPVTAAIPLSAVQTGDLVSLTYPLVRRTPSLILEMASLSITFLDGEDNPLYTFSDALSKDSEGYERRIIGQMLEHVHSTAAQLMPVADSDSMFISPLTGGRFKGLGLLAAMEQSEEGDIRSFLRFIKAFPAKYMGNAWKVDETYATWVLNNTPIAGDDLLEQLLGAESDEAFHGLVEAYRRDIIQEEFLYTWSSDAETKAIDGDVNLGKQMITVVQKVADHLGEQSSFAWAWFGAARIAEQIPDYEEAEKHYRKAKNLFADIGDGRGESFATNNLGGVLYSLGRLTEALDFYEQARVMKEERVEAEGTPQAKESLAYTQGGLGDVYFALENYLKADEAYREAAYLYRAADAQSNVAWALRRIADVEGKTGNSDQAVEVLKDAQAIYREIGDSAGLADAMDGTGYHLSNQGIYQQALENYEQAYQIHLALGDKRDAGFSKSNVGQVYWSLGDYYSAEKAHRLAILLREEAEDLAGQAYSWHKLGDMFRESGDPFAALDAFQKAGNIYRDLAEQANLAEVLNSIGDVFYGQKSFRKALNHYLEALSIQREIGAEEGIGTTLYNIGNTYYGDNKYSKAGDWFRQSLELQQAIGDKGNEVYSLTGLGLVAWNLRNYKEARSYFSDALALAKEINSRSDMAWCYGVMARVSSMKGEYASALEDYNKALELYKETGEKSSLTDILLGIGNIYIQQGKFDQGLALYEESHAIATEVNNRTGIAGALQSTADVHLLLGEFDEAIKANRRSLEINQQVDNPWGIGSSYTGLGNTYNAMGNYRAAVEFYHKADSIFRVLGDTLGRATPMNNIGTVYFFQGDYERALDQFNEVLGIVRAAGQEDEFLVIVLSNIGEVYYEQGRHDDAETWLLQALELAETVGARRIAASTLAILTKSLMARDMLDQAVEQGETALLMTEEIGEQEQRVEIHAVMGELAMRRGDVKKAQEYLNRAVKVADDIGSTKYVWRPLYLLGIVYRDQGKRPEAIANLERSVEVIEQLRASVAGGEAAQKLFASDRAKVRVYEALIALLIEGGEIERALGYLERSSSEDLRARFKSLQPSFADPEKQEILEQNREMKARIDKLAAQIAEERNSDEGAKKEKIERLQEIISIAENEYIKFVNQTVREQPELRNYFSAGVNPIELRQRKQKIPGDIAVVSYLLGERQLFAFVATADTVVARVVNVQRTEVEEAIQGLSRNLDKPGREDRSAPHSARLHELLIGPIEDRVSGYKRLAIIPSGDLHYVPFGTLRTDDEAARYLMEDYTIFYVSDLGVFLDDAERQDDLRLVAFGNADGTLPNAEQEVADIAALYPESKVYVREEATEEKAKNFPQGYNALHFATHGNLDYRRFENSWLTLASGTTSDEDGRLTLEEIWGITNLSDCELVTLSACNTAVSEEVIEGWPINPANAFLQVGVPRVIATLWQVDDVATAQLMTDFYRNLVSHGAADALRLAQIQLRSNPDYAEPYFWAPFVLLGDWR